jgi:hypothetical protein
VLRRFTMDDVEAIVELDSDPNVMRYISGGLQQLDYVAFLTPLLADAVQRRE